MNCDLCGKSFTSKQNLEYHNSHKVCQKNVIKCDLCGSVFTKKTSLSYHLENKVCEKKPHLLLKKKTLPHPVTQYKNLSKNELLLKVVQLEGKIEALTENPTTTVNNTDNSRNINLFFPTAFGKEDIKYIQHKVGDFLGPLIENQTCDSIPRLFTQIHNNQQFPEYHNVYSSSEKSTYVMVSDGNIFKHHSKKTIIDQIIEDKRSILNQYIDENGEQFGENVLRKYEKYQEQIDDDPEFKKNLEIEIGGLLLDMKSVIANDEKTRRLLDKVNEGDFALPLIDKQ
jgi:hypothetical protein